VGIPGSSEFVEGFRFYEFEIVKFIDNYINRSVPGDIEKKLEEISPALEIWDKAVRKGVRFEIL